MIPTTSAEIYHIAIPDFSPENFQTYVHWLYKKTLDFTVRRSDNRTMTNRRFADLYCLGQWLVDTEFRDSIILEWVKDRNVFFPSRSIVHRIYRGTREGSPARRLVVDWWCACADGDLEGWVGSFTEVMGQAFVDDLVPALLRNRVPLSGADPWPTERENYLLVRRNQGRVEGRDGGGDEQNERGNKSS